MTHLLYWGIAIVVYIAQHILSRRQKAYWGAIIPLAYLAYMITILAQDNFHDFKGFILATLGGLAITCGIWATGRDSFNKKRKKELEKIQIQDI
ncbi:hypothetical protein CN918_29875 [Priestia megaterium]|nr:hypothetical protein CN918_29875 [Priestia megaterium]